MTPDLIKAHHALDKLQGTVNKTTDELTDLLAVALSALKNGRVQVATERLEVALEMLSKLKESAK